MIYTVKAQEPGYAGYVTIFILPAWSLQVDNPAQYHVQIRRGFALIFLRSGLWCFWPHYISKKCVVHLHWKCSNVYFFLLWSLQRLGFVLLTETPWVLHCISKFSLALFRFISLNCSLDILELQNNKLTLCLTWGSYLLIPYSLTGMHNISYLSEHVNLDHFNWSKWRTQSGGLL